MGRRVCCSEEEGLVVKRGAWTAIEDQILTNYITIHGKRNWRDIPKLAGLNRCGKSCRLRWLNYLRPDIKRGNITVDEEDLIIRLHNLLGNRWSLIARRLPGRTDNEIKNYWNTVLGKKVKKHGIEGRDGDEKKRKSVSKVMISNKRVKPSSTSTASMSSILDGDEQVQDMMNGDEGFDMGELLDFDVPDWEFWKLCQFF